MSTRLTSVNGQLDRALVGNISLTGGVGNGNQWLKSTEHIYVDGTVTQGQVLPKNTRGLCAVALENNMVLFLGGYNGTFRSGTWWYDINTKQFSDGPQMKYKRAGLACTVFKSDRHAGRSVVLAAGGRGYSSDSSKTYEVLDYTVKQKQWETSKEAHICLYLP